MAESKGVVHEFNDGMTLFVRTLRMRCGARISQSRAMITYDSLYLQRGYGSTMSLTANLRLGWWQSSIRLSHRANEILSLGWSGTVRQHVMCK
jgi:hypothetical protein